MSKVTLICLSVLMSSMLGKTKAAGLGEACTQDSECTSSAAVCQPSTKTCLIGVGGTCSGSTDKCVIGATCTGDSNTICACETGYTVNDKLCAALNTYGGTCTIVDTVDSCVTPGADANAVCTNSKCACKSGYTGAIGVKCYVIPNTYGGSCTITGSTDSCVTPGDDPNAKCSASTNGICGCNTHYTGSIGSKCEPKPKKVGGACTPATTDACEDANAECIAGTRLCTCKANYQTKTSDLTCEPKPKKVGGACTPATTDACEDANAECIASTSLCTCKANYQTKTSDLTCEVIPNKYGGSCSSTGSTDSCVDPGGDPNAKCSANSDGICGCKDNYTGSIGSICIADNTYGGKCTISGTVDSCVTPGGDVNAVCTNSKCACKSGYTGSIGAKCSGTMALTSSVFILIAALLVKTHLE